jgi:hypothetical protein
LMAFPNAWLIIGNRIVRWDQVDIYGAPTYSNDWWQDLSACTRDGLST